MKKLSLKKINKEYGVIIASVFTGLLAGFFFLSPFAMLVSDLVHDKLIKDAADIYVTPWSSIAEAFHPDFLLWGLMFALFSGALGFFAGLYLKAKRKYVHKLNQNYRHLQHLERLKDTLTQMAVHDLSNPLTALDGSIHFLKTDPLCSVSDDQKDILKSASAGVQQMRMLISNILDVTKMEEDRLDLNLREVDPEKLIDGALDSLKIMAELNRKEIGKKISPGLPQVVADEQILSRIITNLVMNAFKYSSDGSKVEVGARLDESNNKVVISVSDNGYGIPKEHKDRIFNKFVQLKDKQDKSRRGYGLGLTFCKMAVEAQGGKIWVESELGKGSTFYFTVPIKGGGHV